MSPPNGFRFSRRSSGDVVIEHHGRVATVLRGTRAAAFLDEVDGPDPQQVMARWTGNYRRGNERLAALHPRNGRSALSHYRAARR